MIFLYLVVHFVLASTLTSLIFFEVKYLWALEVGH